MAERISLILTVCNEAKSIERFFDDLTHFTRLPDDLVIVDGGSTDGTRELIKQHIADCPVPLTFIESKGCSIAEGRNIAVRAAVHNLIAVTDAGCAIEPTWLEHLVAPFEADPDLDMVGGAYDFIRDTPVQQCYADLRQPVIRNDNTFLPSHRSVAYRRSVWDRIGGYPAQMTVGEDTWFDLRARELGCTMAVARDAVVHWEGCATCGELWRKYFRYGRSCGEVAQRAHVYGFYAVNLAMLALWPVLAMATNPVFWGVFAGHFMAYSWLRLFRRESVRKGMHIGSIARYYAVMTTLDVASSAGYLSGLAKRRDRSYAPNRTYRPADTTLRR